MFVIAQFYRIMEVSLRNLKYQFLNLGNKDTQAKPYHQIKSSLRNAKFNIEVADDSVFLFSAVEVQKEAALLKSLNCSKEMFCAVANLSLYMEDYISVVSMSDVVVFGL